MVWLKITDKTHTAWFNLDKLYRILRTPYNKVKIKTHDKEITFMIPFDKFEADFLRALREYQTSPGKTYLGEINND